MLIFVVFQAVCRICALYGLVVVGAQYSGAIESRSGPRVQSQSLSDTRGRGVCQKMCELHTKISYWWNS